MNILIRNLSRDTTEKEIFALFSAYGRVVNCNLVLDGKTGKSKGFGFADMPDEKEARAAIKGLNGKPVRGSHVRVKESSRSGPRG